MKDYLIFTPDIDINEDHIEYSDVIRWALDNTGNSDVLVLKLNEVYRLQYQSEALDIINAENSSMLQEGEDDWVFDPDVKDRIILRLEGYLNTLEVPETRNLVYKIQRLFVRSIEKNKPLHILF
ncbi:MAG: hypothetical protein ABWZ25_18065 [Chitinophagaceae bacterium]